MAKDQSKTGQIQTNKNKNKNKKMKITYEPTANSGRYDGRKITENWLANNDPRFIQKTVTLDHPMDDMTLVDLMDTMVVPMLLSMGYSQVSINRIIDTDEDK